MRTEKLRLKCYQAVGLRYRLLFTDPPDEHWIVTYGLESLQPYL